MVILRRAASHVISLFQKSTPAKKNSLAFHHGLDSDLDVTLKTTDSGHGGSSVGSHSPTNPTINSDNIMRSRSESQRSVQMPPPNSGPPPRHLLPAKLKPSPGVKMHPPALILDFKGK